MAMATLNFTASVSNTTSLKVGEQARDARTVRPASVNRCQAGEADRSATSRRAMLASVGGAALSFGYAKSSEAFELNRVCSPYDDGADCRRGELAKDNAGQNLDYNQFSSRDKGRTASVGAKDNDSAFAVVTAELVDKVRVYVDMAPFDKQRPVLAAELQKEGNAWVGKYAPGGSCKNESCRSFYSALSSLLGHMAFNGLAPMRGSMLAQIEKNCASTLELIEKGR
eukprot:CAMPEP_0118934060 /NCGR_PEP_ID=MMETSP1169-20130426/13485_1 /TAXON_ID=36882 /ORGANISM="Pyramimonas obovata, Strain CCMP722" /LENGTH=225 /DNA_ID=CAMNT_0006876921 /DNA_START=65 /DNA_END=742 /DNA_ORIENTATION=-